jgi:hypothetical protein
MVDDSRHIVDKPLQCFYAGDCTGISEEDDSAYFRYVRCNFMQESLH